MQNTVEFVNQVVYSDIEGWMVIVVVAFEMTSQH